MSALASHTVLPASGERPLLADLKAVLASDEDVVVSSLGGSAPLPESLRRLLLDAVDALQGGNAVSVAPRRTLLTTQEGAELLGITRPTFVRLLEAGRIPYTSPGRHRRVELADVLAFQDQERSRRRLVLEEMAREATPDPDDADDGFVSTR